MSWKNKSWIASVLAAVGLLFIFTGTDEETVINHQESKFIKETEELISALSAGNTEVTKLTPKRTDYNQTEPQPSLYPTENISAQASEDNISTSFESTPQVKQPIAPDWKNILDVFLQGNASPKEFINSLSLENWKDARDALALAYEEEKLTPSKNFQERFWMKVGEIGGEAVAKELLMDSDPAFSKILKGWAKGDPQEMFDYYTGLDLTSHEIQNYLDKTNSREIPLMDQFSSGMIDEILRNSNGKIGNTQVETANDLIDHFLEKDKKKAESLMREFTERVTKGRDKDTLKQWVSGYKEPELQAGTAQRVIESGVFDKNPLEAVEFANSLESTKAKRSALSSAYARLAGGVNGHDPNITAAELNKMENGWQRDFALNGFAHGLVHRDPEAAIQWANSISNEGFRKVVTKNVTKRINAEVLPRLNSQGASKN